MGERSLRRVIPADLARISEVREWLGQVAQSVSLGDCRIFDLQVVVSEAIANGIEHAASEVEIVVWPLPDRLMIEVTNDGAFRPGIHKDDSGRRRGLGLPLMVSLADQVHVSRLMDNRTLVSITFYLPGRTGLSAFGDGLTSASAFGNDTPGTVNPGYAWVALPFLAIAIFVLAAAHVGSVFNPPGLFTAFNLLFITFTSLLISTLAIRTYLVRGARSVILLGSGSLALALGAALSAIHAGGAGANPLAASYNTAAVLAGLCYLAAAVSSFWPGRIRSYPRRVPVAAGTYTLVAILLLVFTVLIRDGIWPLHLVQGVGTTTFGSAFALASAALFGLSALIWVVNIKGVSREFRSWYALGLALLALGGVGASLVVSAGGPVSWVSRWSVYLGSSSVLLGALLTARRAGSWHVHLESALEEAKNRYQILVDLSPDAILVEAPGRRLFANAAAARLLGTRSLEELLDKTLYDSVYPMDRELVEDRMSQTLAGGVTPPGEIRLVRSDGAVLVAELTASRVGFEGQLAVQAVLRDVTDRKRVEQERDALLGRHQSLNEELKASNEELRGQAEDLLERERALRESERRFSLVFQKAAFPMAMSREGVLADVNEEWERLFGFTREEVLGKTTLELGINRDPAARERSRNEPVEHGAIRDHNLVLFTKSGEARVVSNNLDVMDVDGDTYLLSTVRDITDYKRVEGALLMRESDLARAERAAHIGTWRWDLTADRLTWSNELYRIFGVDPRAFVPSSAALGLMIHPADRARHVETMKMARTHGTAPAMECRIVRPSGEERIVSYGGLEAERDRWDEPRILFGSVLDITERKRAELERENLLQEAQQLTEELTTANEELHSQADELSAQAGELKIGYEEQATYADLGRALLKATNTLHASVAWDEAFNHALALGARALGADVAALDGWEGDGFRISHVYGVSSDLIGDFIPASSAPYGAQAIASGETVSVDRLGGQYVPGGLTGNHSIKSMIVAPCYVRGRPLAALFYDFTHTSHTFTEAETDFVAQLAASLSLALENLQLFHEQASLLERLQTAYFDIPKQFSQIEVGHEYRSATAGALVGGDFYDLLLAPDGRLVVVIGDVSGRGLEAARIATLTKDVFSVLALQGLGPAEVLTRANDVLVHRGVPGFVTAFVGFLDLRTGELAYSSAGHPSPLIAQGSSVTALSVAASLPLGSLAGTRYRTDRAQLREGAVVILYTDGLTEARTSGELFGETRLAESLSRHSAASARQIPALMIQDGVDFAGASIADDVAVLAFRFRMPPSSDRDQSGQITQSI